VPTKSFEPLRIYGKIAGREKIPHGGFNNVDTNTAGSKLSRWLRGNLFIPDARKGWNRYALRAAKKLISDKKIETVVTTGPPHSTHLIGLALKKQFGIRWIADFRDPWTDIYYYDQLLHTASAAKRDASLELAVLEGADMVLAVCPSNAALFREKLGIRSGKVQVLTNGYDESDFPKGQAAANDGILNIGYTGTIAPTYNAVPIFEILAKLSIPWQLNIAGSVAPEVKQVLSQLGLNSKVNYLGYLPHAESLKVLMGSNVLLHILPDTDKNRMGTTGKLFEYIGSGAPILNIGPGDGDAAIFIKEAGAGATYGRDKPKAITAFLTEIAEGKFKHAQLGARFTRKTLASQFVTLLSTAKKIH
jgi:glycosyltransferase involved in cell wall biosynthesis